MTERLHRHLWVEPDRKTFSAIAREVGLTEGTVRNVFSARVDELLKGYSFETPRVLGIDEKHLLGKYRCIIGNVEERTLLDIMANRYKNRLSDYLDRLPDKDRVEVVCQDMYDNYRTLARKHFPKAAIVVDKFHVVMKANDAVEKFRRKLNSTMLAEDRTKLKNQRKILLARYRNLSGEAREKLDGWFAKYPTLEEVYWLKERFFDFYDADTAGETDARYQRWLGLLKPEYEPFFADLNRCMRNWRPHIHSYFDHRYTNAYVEGINRSMDSIQREGRGYSFEAMRAKALLAHGHHKRELPKFIRERFDNKFVSMPREVWASLPKVNYGVDFESLRQVVAPKNTVHRWDGSRYVKQPLPSALSTLRLADLAPA
jgi:transposase